MKWEKLANLGKIVSGSTPSTSVAKYWDSGIIPWVTPADLAKNEDIFFNSTPRMITEEGYNSCSTTLLPAGSILFSSRAPIGHCAVASYAVCTNQGVKSIVPNSELDSVYGYFALRYFTEDISAMGRGATFDEVTKEMMEEFEIPLLPLAEQRRIAAILRAADDERRRRRYTQSLSDGLLREIFVRMFGDPATNPMGWDVFTIGQVLSGSQYGTSEKSNQEGRGYPILGMGNITFEGRIDLSTLAYVEISHAEFQRLRLKSGDVIFNRTNSTELVGKTACWRHDMDVVLASYLVKLTLFPTVVPEYFVAVLNTPYFKGLFQERCKKAIGQSNISPTLLSEFSIAVPTLDLQREFAAVVAEHERVRRQQQESARQSDHLFDTLLHQAFTGEL